MLSEVPDEWEKCSLGEVLSLEYGKSLPEKTRVAGDYPVYGSAGIVGSHNEYLVDSQSIVVGRKGTVGAIYKTSQPFFPIDTTYYVVAKNELNWDWLAALLESLQLAKLNEATGVPGLNRERAYASEIPIPPLNEQHRIAEILSSVDASIQATQAVIEQAERVKRGLMEELLTGGLGSEAIERGEVPEGWESSSIGALTELQNGYGFKSKDWAQEGLPIIRIQNLNGGGDFNYFNGKYDEKYLVQKGDLLFCWSGSRGTSFGARYWTQEEGLLNQHIFKCIPKDGVEKAFLYYLLDWMTLAIEKEAHGGAGLAHIKKSEMVAFSCCIPPVSEQQRIAEVLSDSDDFIARQKSIVEQQNLIKRGLMDDLLTGKVRTV